MFRDNNMKVYCVVKADIICESFIKAYSIKESAVKYAMSLAKDETKKFIYRVDTFAIDDIPIDNKLYGIFRSSEKCDEIYDLFGSKKACEDRISWLYSNLDEIEPMDDLEFIMKEVSLDKSNL